jgi:DNA repair protein RadA/Sms
VAKLRLIHRCTECGAAHPKWSGKCLTCGAWNSLVEDIEEPTDTAVTLAAGMALVPPGEATLIGDIDATVGAPATTHIGELDRVLGGGIVPGSVTLLGGEPGIGKSTLLLQLLAAAQGVTLYVSAEESAQQIRMRATRLNALSPQLWLLPEMSLPHIISSIDTINPSLIVIDSIQTVADPELGSTPGSVVQVRGCAHRLVQEAKRRNIPMVLVGHVTKEGGLAGPRVLEHVVDTVLSFEGERHHALRMLRASKHRFGPTNELGLFEMTEGGLVGVPDASSMFLSDRRTGVPGSVIVPTIEGQRPLLVEVQALTNATHGGGPSRRSVQGLDNARLSMLLAVLERRARISFATHDVYASVVGGVKLTEPGADLGLCLALVSALTNTPLPADLVVVGEVGLAGEVRHAAHTSQRLFEAQRLGFTRALVPTRSPDDIKKLLCHPVRTLNEALAFVGMLDSSCS